MKILVIFLAVPILAVSAALTPADIIQFGRARQKCGNEYTIDPTSLDRARAGEMVNDPQFDCYMACILQGMHLMGADGKLDRDAAIDKVPNAPFHDGLVGAINSCANQSGRNNCDTARRLLACMQDQGSLQVKRVGEFLPTEQVIEHLKKVVYGQQCCHVKSIYRKIRND